MQLPTEPVQNVKGTDHYLVPQSVGVRGVAYILDSLVFALITVGFLYALGAVEVVLQSTALSWPQLAVVGAQCGYFFVFEALFGWTPGKLIMQMRVVRPDGRKVGLAGALIRNVIRPLDLLFFGVVGVASILAGFKRQRIGDRLGHTQVVRELPLSLVPPPYVPADKSSRRCPRCGALAEGEQSTCAVCGLDLDSAPPWPFGGIMRPGGPAPGRTARPQAAPRQRRPPPPPKKATDRPRAEQAGRPAAERLSRAAAERPDKPLPYESPHSAHAMDLHAGDADERLFAAREILLNGDQDEARELAKVVQGWEHDDRQFVIDVARTLDGWRPVMVLEALRADRDEELALSAQDALATVEERTRRDEEERRAWEAARATRSDDDAPLDAGVFPDHKDGESDDVRPEHEPDTGDEEEYQTGPEGGLEPAEWDFEEGGAGPEDHELEADVPESAEGARPGGGPTDASGDVAGAGMLPEEESGNEPATGRSGGAGPVEERGPGTRAGSGMPGELEDTPEAELEEGPEPELDDDLDDDLGDEDELFDDFNEALEQELEEEPGAEDEGPPEDDRGRSSTDRRRV